MGLLRTLVKPSDPGDIRLRKERESTKIPLSKSPFPRRRDKDGYLILSTSGKETDLEVEAAHEVAWLDLLLELAMTTAFANLADNTEIQSLNGVASYVAFIALVWWIWASQVAYNMRFRQADWIHRCCSFAQLAIFSGMAAFTNNFDITTDLVVDAEEKALADQVSALGGASRNAIFAQDAQLRNLPIINARGIAVVMALSRLLMMVQYAVTYSHARSALLIHRKALNVQLISLIISFVLFSSSYSLITADPIMSIVKIVLWYSAILIEIIAHFVSNKVPGHVKYSGDAVFERSSTAFIVILGIGLDKITSQFQFVVGRIGFNASSILSSLSIAVIFIGLFSLYFSTTTEIHAGNHRSLTYFLAHFPFMAAILIMLKGVGSLLANVNLTNATTQLLTHMAPALSDAQAGSRLSSTSYPLLVKDFQSLGLAPDDFLGGLFNVTLKAIKKGASDGGAGARLQLAFRELLVLYKNKP